MIIIKPEKDWKAQKPAKTPIICFQGKRGNGKTLLMTWMLNYYAITNKQSVFSNYHLDIPNVQCQFMTKEYLASFFEKEGDGFTKLENCLLAIDEFASFIDSYSFRTKNAKRFSHFVVQTRKKNISVFYSTQQINLVPLRIRMNTDYLIEPHYSEAGDMITYDLFEFEYPFKRYLRTLTVFDVSKVFGMFDSREVIKSIEDED